MGGRGNQVTSLRSTIVLILACSFGVSAEQLPIRAYAEDEGLAHHRVRRIKRDSRGFLWFCSGERLSRFDGHHFTTYDLNDGPSDIVEAGPGVYWVATYGGGVHRFSLTDQHHRTQSTRYSLGTELASNQVNVIHRDHANRVWAGTDDGLYMLDESRGESAFHRVNLELPIQAGTLVEVGSFAEDREGSLWIGTSYGLVRHLPDGRIIIYSLTGPPLRFVRALLSDRDGRIWIGHSGGLIVMHPGPVAIFGEQGFGTHSVQVKLTRTTKGALPSDTRVARWFTGADGAAAAPVVALYQFSEGTIMAGTHGAGLLVWEGERFRRYTTAHGLKYDIIYALGEDAAGNRWMGGPVGGAVRMARSGFTWYGEADGLRPMRVVSLFENRSGELSIVSSNRLNRQWRIDVFNGRRFHGTQLQLPAVKREIPSAGLREYPVLQDHTGEWWVGSGEGLYRFAATDRPEELRNARPKAVYKTEKWLANSGVISLFEDSSGDIWMGYATHGGGGIARWQRRTETTRRYSQSDGLPLRLWPTLFGQDAGGNLWIALHMTGLVRFRRGHFELFNESDGLPSTAIQALFRDSVGRVWVGTARGVGRIDNPTGEHPRALQYSTATGLTSDDTTCFTEDQRGNLYIGTNRGVDRLDVATGKVRHYALERGMYSSDVVSAFRDRYGSLWFGTYSGVARLAPVTDHSPVFPAVWLSEVRVSGVPRLVSEFGETRLPHLRLGPEHTQIHLSYFGLSFTGPLRYQYKVVEGEGGGAWSGPSDQTSVDFINMAPGTYHFLVRAINADGLASEVPAKLSFTIDPPIWRRAWFIATLAVLGALALFALHRYRLGRILDVERVRTRIATDLHDDIGSALSQISVLSEVVSQRLARREAAFESLSAIGGLSRDLVDSLNDIVWAINPNRDSLSDLTKRMHRFANDFVSGHNAEFSFHVPETQHDVKMGADVRREVFLIFKESITNAVRHSGCTHLIVEFMVKDGLIDLYVKDNGRGFDIAQVTEGNGLWSMHRRAAKLGGVLEVKSIDSEGTTVRLRAPLNRRKWPW